MRLKQRLRGEAMQLRGTRLRGDRGLPRTRVK
jgi:hypothetical protein